MAYVLLISVCLREYNLFQFSQTFSCNIAQNSAKPLLPPAFYRINQIRFRY